MECPTSTTPPGCTTGNQSAFWESYSTFRIRYCQFKYYVGTITPLPAASAMARLDWRSVHGCDTNIKFALLGEASVRVLVRKSIVAEPVICENHATDKTTPSTNCASAGDNSHARRARGYAYIYMRNFTEQVLIFSVWGALIWLICMAIFLTNRSKSAARAREIRRIFAWGPFSIVWMG